MGVSDKFRASMPSDAGEPEGVAGGEREGPDRVDPQDAETDIVAGPTERRVAKSSDTPRRRTAKGKALEDPDAMLRRLEGEGFSRAEAGRLIFERMRPRGEGLGRS
ncbi:MAG: hypothetical protein M3442_16115 [Chloroflexota bacterium]|nr:hypothetical protein [Chloroflexota bacterium]